MEPSAELQTGRFPNSAGVLAVGRDDPDLRPQDEQVTALGRALPWIAARTGLPDRPGPSHRS